MLGPRERSLTVRMAPKHDVVAFFAILFGGIALVSLFMFGGEVGMFVACFVPAVVVFLLTVCDWGNREGDR